MARRGYAATSGTAWLNARFLPFRTAAPDAATAFRFSSKGPAALRRRLAFSAADLDFLLYASVQSVYNWEAVARPGANQLPTIAALRKLTKPQVAELLKSLRA